MASTRPTARTRARLGWARAKASLSTRLQQGLRTRGILLQRYEPDELTDQARRARLIRSLGVDLVLDVGAAGGRYGLELRRGGYEGRIVSFEPLEEAFARLGGACARDPAWRCLKQALGSSVGAAEINVAANSDSSSLLPLSERHLRSAPESAFVLTEKVELRTLDSIWDQVADGAERPFLKLDVQGFELEVLRGAAESLPALVGVQAELSLVPLYRGAPGFQEVIGHLERLGFRLAGLETGFHDRETGELLQADGIFVRA